MNIGNKIVQLRREKGATQEQLANFVGVSVAAVSKWETDSSYPDITLLPLIAEFFEVSIDALMDFDLTNEKKEMLSDLHNQYFLNSDYEAGLPLYEEAVKKYPNDFELVYEYGTLLSSKAFSSIQLDRDTALKAVRYLEKAILLHKGQALDINSIRQRIACIYGGLGEYGKAIHILQETGENTHEIQIADYLIEQGDKYDEAKTRLQNVLFHFAFEFSQHTSLLGKCFIQEGDQDTALKLEELCAEFREHFANSDTPNFFNALSSYDYSRLALSYKKHGQTDDMWNALSKAVFHAERFDKEPSYRACDVEFMKGMTGHISSTSKFNACHSLIKDIENNFSEFQTDNRYVDFMKRLNEAKQDKKESGIWQ